MILECYKCKVTKNESEFHKNSRRVSGYRSDCKECRRGTENKRKLDAYYANKEKYAANHKEWQATNKDHYNTYMRNWNKLNKDYSNPQNRQDRADYRARLLNATPKWGDNSKIKAIYILAKTLENDLKIKLHVDHIAPLKGKDTSGLHVWYNLQILPGKVNQSKGNKIIENITFPRVSDNFNDYLIEVENICRTYAIESVRSKG